MTIVSCPASGHKLRVPEGKRGTVRCPHCGAEWFHPETLELCDVEFRCSLSGAYFNVISSRRSPLHKFIIQEIKKPAAGATRPRPEETPPSPPRPTVKIAPLSSLQLAAPRAGRWLARIIGRTTETVPRVRSTSEPARNGATSGSTLQTAVHNVDDYNWSGFCCPYCNASGFVSCGRGHLTCDGTVEMRSGGRFRQCFCGNAGFLQGVMKNVSATRLSVEAGLVSSMPAATEIQGPSGKATTAVLSSSTSRRPPAKR
jgi:hypothetical protein